MTHLLKREALLGYLLVAVAGTLWGTGGTFIYFLRHAGAHVNLASLMGHLFALLPLLLFIQLKEGMSGLKISRGGLFYAVIMGIIGKALFVLSFNQTLTLLGSSTGTIVLYTSPIFTAILSELVLKERLKSHQLIALGLNLLACVLVVTGGNFTSLTISHIGILFGILSAFLYALNTLLGKLSAGSDKPITMTFYMLLFSTLTMLPVVKPWEHLEIMFRADVLILGMLYALLTGFIANVCYISGLNKPIQASRVPIVASLEVVVACLLGVMVLGEPFNGISLIGIMMLLFSIVLMNFERSESKIKIIRQI